MTLFFFRVFFLSNRNSRDSSVSIVSRLRDERTRGLGSVSSSSSKHTLSLSLSLSLPKRQASLPFRGAGDLLISSKSAEAWR